MNAEMQRFNDAVIKDKKLADELKAKKPTDAKSLVAFANAKGYKFSEADLTSAKGELSEKDLDKVAGGGSFIGSLSGMGMGGGGLISW